MKRFILIVSFLLLILPLSASLTFSEDVSSELRERLGEAVSKAVGDRNDLEVTISSLSEEDSIVSLVLSFDGRTVEISVEEEYLEAELRSLFYYDDALFEDGERLDYIYRSSFSSVTLSSAVIGQNYAVVGESGKTEALLRVSSVYDNAVVFSPVYLASPLPGMKIERVNDFTLRLSAFSNLSLSSFGTSLSLSYSSLLYPVIPFVEAAVIKRSGGFSLGAYAGARCEFLFSSVWSEVPVVKNLSVGGEAALGFAVSAESVSLSVFFAFDATYTFSRIFSLSLGLRNYDGTNYLSLTLGGKL